MLDTEKIKIKLIKKWEKENSSQILITRKRSSGYFKSLSSHLLSGLILAGLFSGSLYVFAVPPVSKYDSATGVLNPNCSPDPVSPNYKANCTVNTPITYTGATAPLNLNSQNILTTGVGSFGSLSVDNAIISTNGSGVLQIGTTGGGTYYTLPTSRGVFGQFLTAGSNGSVSWTDIVSGVPYTGATGSVNLGSHSLTTTGVATIGGNTDAVQLVVKGNSSQSSNLQRWQDSSSGTIASMSSAGVLTASGFSGDGSNLTSVLHPTGSTDAVDFSGASGVITTVDQTGQSHMLWLPGKSAFRAGAIGNGNWDNVNVGSYSVGLGYSTKASGDYSTAFGYQSRATGLGSTAFGNSSEAAGSYSFAAGSGAYAGGSTSMALGNGASAYVDGDIAIGSMVVRAGYSIGIGTGITSGEYTTPSSFGVAFGQTDFSVASQAVSMQASNMSGTGIFILQNSVSNITTNLNLNSNTAINTTGGTGDLLVIDASGNINIYSGTLTAASLNLLPGDVAENYPTKDDSLEAGDLTALDISNAVFVTKANQVNSSMIIGVVSTKPGMIFGGGAKNPSGQPRQYSSEKKVAVALIGRVPVKVNGEGGPISIGDRIGLSSVSGVGKKVAEGFDSIGIALESFDGSDVSTAGSILVFVKQSLGFNLAKDGTVNQGQVAGMEGSEFLRSVKDSLETMGIKFADGIASISEIVADKASSKVSVADLSTVAKIQMIDQTNGDIYCTYLNNGEWQKTKGQCSDVTQVAIQTIAVQAVLNPEDIKQQVKEELTQELGSSLSNKVNSVNGDINNLQNQVQGLQQQTQLTVASIINIPDITVTQGTDLASANVPTNVNCVMSDGNVQLLAVIWDAGEPTYDLNSPGTYAFSGNLILPTNIINPSGSVAKINVIIQPQAQSDQSLQPGGLLDRILRLFNKPFSMKPCNPPGLANTVKNIIPDVSQGTNRLTDSIAKTAFSISKTTAGLAKSIAKSIPVITKNTANLLDGIGKIIDKQTSSVLSSVIKLF